MKNKISLFFADAYFNIYSDRFIAIDDAFSDFIINGEHDGVNINVFVGSLPEINSIPDFKSETREYFNSFLTVRTSYFDYKKKEYVPYAVFEATDRDDNYTLYYSFKDNISLKSVFDAVYYPSILLRKSVALMHASFSVINNRAVLFTGVSGAGKTTQSLLWQKYRDAEIVNGDRTALKISDDGVTAYGIPFCGSSKTAKNVIAPLEAIVFPVKSQINKAVELDKSSVSRILIGNFSYTAESARDSELIWNFINGIIEKTRFIKLYCTPDENAVNALESIL